MIISLCCVIDYSNNISLMSSVKKHFFTFFKSQKTVIVNPYRNNISAKISKVL